MTFGAMAAWQAWLLLAGAGAAAAALFFLKVRPPRVPVPSLLLWRRVLDESRELTIWERIRRAVSLAVTLAIALALALAIARPARVGGATTAGSQRLLVVLDSSWSMQARTRGGERRWDRGVAEARRIVAAASGREMALATTADGLVEGPTSDGTLIEAALDRVSPGGSERAAWPRLAGPHVVHFVTDGASPRTLPEDVVVHSVFEPAPNVAVTAFEVRPSLAGAAAEDAYLEIANFAPAPQRVRVTLTRGEARIFDREIDVGGSEILRQVVPIPRRGDPALRAHVDARENALDADDEAVAWIDRAKPISVVVVGDQTAWLRPVLAGDSGIAAAFTTLEGYRPGTEDVAIFAGCAPAAAPARPALLFAPPIDTEWLTDAGEKPGASGMEARPQWQVPGEHAVVAGVDPFTLWIERARRYSAPWLAPVAVSAGGTPLVSVSETPDRRLVVVSFGASESNLAGAPGFPVLVGNALDWLTHPAAPGVRQPGLVTFESGVARITGPDGAPLALSRMNGTSVAMLRGPGLYTAEGGGARSTIAVNISDPALSNLARTSAAGGGRVETVSSHASARPLWVYLGAAAFALALLEWWTWQRRITV
jgi:hypothetical protein